MLCLSRKRMVVTKDRPQGPGRSVLMFIVVECEDHSAIQAPQMCLLWLLAVGYCQKNCTLLAEMSVHEHWCPHQKPIGLDWRFDIFKNVFLACHCYSWMEVSNFCYETISKIGMMTNTQHRRLHLHIRGRQGVPPTIFIIKQLYLVGWFKQNNVEMV